MRLVEYLESQKDCIRCQGLLLSFQAGIRIGELCSLTPEDVSREGYVHVHRTEIKVRDENGKWKKEIQEYPKTEAGDRNVIVSERATDTIRNILNTRWDGEYLFMEDGKLLYTNSFRRKLMRVCEKLGIDYKSNHKIRKTYGTMLLDGGVDESLVAEQMGHADVSTTKKYYYYNNKSEAKRKKQINDAVIF